MPRRAVVTVVALLVAFSGSTTATARHDASPVATRLARALAVPHVRQSRTAAVAVELAEGRTIFARHQMQVVGFWEPLDKEAGAGEKLVYVLAHQSRAAAEASWKAFRDDPEWVKVKADSEKDGVLTAKIESVFLAATDYSPMK